MERVAGGDGLEDLRVVGDVFAPVRRLVLARFEVITSRGREGHQADAACGISAGVLKVRELVHEVLLAGVFPGAVQGIDVVQHTHEDLEPVGLGALELLDLKPERGLLRVVGLLHEVGEAQRLLRHLFGNLLRGFDGLGVVLLHVLPLRGGDGDLRGDLLEVLNLAGGGLELIEFVELGGGQRVRVEGEDGHPSRTAHGGEGQHGDPDVDGVLALVHDPPSEVVQRRRAR